MFKGLLSITLVTAYHYGGCLCLCFVWLAEAETAEGGNLGKRRGKQYCSADFFKSWHFLLQFRKVVASKIFIKKKVVASSAVKTALEMDVKAIIVLSLTGKTARAVAMHKPSVPVLVLYRHSGCKEAPAASVSETHPLSFMHVYQE